VRRNGPTESPDLNSEEQAALEIAHAVKELRAHFNESQQAFATRLGLSIRGIANYEGTLRIPEPRILALFAKTASGAGRDDLAFEFLHEIGHALQLEEMLDGAIMSWNATKKRGYLLVQLNDEKARERAQAYYKASRGHLRDAETKARAQELLTRFTADVSKLPQPSQRGIFKRALQEKERSKQ